jgi:hypothetical protein
MQQNPATAPPPRYRPSMAYHSATGTIVLFGGFDSSFNLLNDTWIWNGLTWTEQHSASAPSARYSAALADDPENGMVVLFGGSDGSASIEGDLGDTWTWDGTMWTRRMVTIAPVPSFSGNMAYDAARQTVLLFGGASLAKGALRDTWFWEGSAVPQALSVASRKTHGVAGIFEIDLPLAGGTGIESRSGGTSAAHQIVVRFGGAITFGSAAVTGGTGTLASTIGNGTAEVTANLMGVGNAQTITVTLFGVNDGAATGDVEVRMGVLTGDISANGAVNSSDVAQAKVLSGDAVTESNFHADVNANGFINSSDISLVKSKSGSGLP